MTAHNPEIDRDKVLFAFYQECPRPSAQNIIDWTERYPALADDIIAHAAVRLDVAPDSNDNTLEPDSTLLSQGHSRALDVLFKARGERAAKTASNDTSAASWDQALRKNRTDIPALARKLDIDRMVLAEFSAGRMRPPIGQRLIDALAHELNETPAWLAATASSLHSSPRLGLAKSHRAPTIGSRSYEDVINASKMPPARKRYWLGED